MSRHVLGGSGQMEQKEEKLYDLVIIGGGPAGLTAAIYAARARLETVLLEEQYIAGGQVMNTYEVDNYPGLPKISGLELAQQMEEHAKELGVPFVQGAVRDIGDAGEVKTVRTENGCFRTRTVLFACGARHAKLGVPGEEAFVGKGVSYCATCDGAFYRDRTVCVIGGGDVAVEDAVFLARGCRKVYLIHRRDTLRAAKILVEAVNKLDNVEILWDTEVRAIEGEDEVSSVQIYNKKKDCQETIAVRGVFVAVGMQPNNALVRELLQLDEQGYVVADERCITSRPGFFAAGDMRTKMLRQILTAAADGANAVTSVQQYLLTIAK